MTTACLEIRSEPRHGHGLLFRVLDTLRQWRRRARDRDQLGRLDERMLRDIGLTHAEAVLLSSRPFWKE